MTIKDTGPQPQSFDLERATREKRTTGRSPGAGATSRSPSCPSPWAATSGWKCIRRPTSFFELDAGRGRAQIGPSKDQLTFDREVADGWCVLIPAGTWHNVTNTGDEPMQVYAIYAPAHHKPGKVHRTAADASSDTDDDPAEWSVQPGATPDDQHA